MFGHTDLLWIAGEEITVSMNWLEVLSRAKGGFDAPSEKDKVLKKTRPD